MNDPTQNELLSAYLDGELNAAERADVERLLAADPAARQLLDDLRAISVTLQALPQEKIGEDLSGAVLRTAARRVLLEGAPGETEDATPESVPLGRSVFRRLFNARGLAYAGIAVAFAVVITVFERHQDGPAADKDAKQAALATPKPEKSAEEHEDLPPTIRAARDSVVESAKPADAPDEKIAGTAEEPSAERFATKPAKRAAPAPEAPLAFSAVPLANKAMSGRAAAADKKALAGKEVLVVHCDVTPEAVARKTFEKLLAANGIARRRQLELGDLDYTKTSGDGAVQGGRAKEKRQKDAEIAPPPESGEVALIYVEATPEQIEATLAALAARPKAFSNVSVNPPRGAPPSHLALGRLGRIEARPKAGAGVGAGEGFREKATAREPGKAAQSEAASRGGAGTFGAAPPANNLAESQQTPARDPDAPGEANGRIEADADEHDADKLRRETKKKEDRHTQSSAQPIPRQRVLFVLRVAGGDHPPAAAARIKAADQPEAAKSKQEAAPPAEAPAKQK
ncbi:MAG: hypothetical protein KKE86_05405 [Planctomycetes bacterium]|nr:hypothetical protein [Planctomycetota bacterium]MCG2682009.1 hypothetical protein [Planctomycetales bacterium]